MKPSLRFPCPKCGVKFSFWPGSSNRVRDGYLSTPWYQCPHCGMVSRQTPNWPHVLWAWPLAFLGVVSVLALAHNTDSLVALHRYHPGLYGALGGLSAGLCFSIGRFGLKLTPMFGVSEPRSHWGMRTWFKVFLIAAVALAIALVTHRWIATLMSLAICLIVSGAFYSFTRQKDKQQVEATAPRDGVPASRDP